MSRVMNKVRATIGAGTRGRARRTPVEGMRGPRRAGWVVMARAEDGKNSEYLTKSDDEFR